jgi:hypothetical protein
MINMTREDATKVMRALEDIENFEHFCEEIDTTLMRSEAYISVLDFYQREISPALNRELTRRKKVLEEM